MGGSRGRRVAEGRSLVSYRAIRGYEMSFTQIGRGMNISVQGSLHKLERGEDEFQRKGRGFADLLL